MNYAIGENRGTRATPAQAVSLQATANCPRSGSIEGVMSSGRPGRSLLGRHSRTARLNALVAIGQMPLRDRNPSGQAWGIPGKARGFGRHVTPAGSCGVATAPGFRPLISDRQVFDTNAAEHPASPARQRSEKGTVDRFGGTGVRAPAARPGFFFTMLASAAMSDDEWPILDPVKLQAAFAATPSVEELFAADATRQNEILALWHDRRANGDEFEQKAADTRIWWIECDDRYQDLLAKHDFLDIVTEDQNR
jgi:hypothetical protein